jgi:hypothetical protein
MKTKKLSHLNDGFVAIVAGDKALLIGAVKKDEPYVIAENSELVSAPTLEGLKTILTERGLKFNETPLRPISQ